jgi:hypothetical protein
MEILDPGNLLRFKPPLAELKTGDLRFTLIWCQVQQEYLKNLWTLGK